MRDDDRDDFWFSIFLVSVLVFIVAIGILTMDGGSSMSSSPPAANLFEPQKQDERWVDDDPRR